MTSFHMKAGWELPFFHRVRCLPRFMQWGIVCGGAAAITAGTVHFQSRRPQGDAPPQAPSIAEWNALPPDAVFTYQVTEIRLENPQTYQGPISDTWAINNKGQVVGSYRRDTTPFWRRHLKGVPFLRTVFPQNQTFGQCAAVYWSEGRTDLLPFLPGFASIRAAYINDRGQIAGDAETDLFGPPYTDHLWHAIFWNAPSTGEPPRDIGVSLGPLMSGVFGINAQGQVGVQADGDVPNPQIPGQLMHVSRPFLWDNGVLRPMTHGTTNAQASGLNNKGEAVGFINGTQPARFSAGHAPVILSKLSPAGVEAFWPTYINNKGDIAGNADRGPFLYSAFLFHEKALLRFGTSSGVDEEGEHREITTGLNQGGDIIFYRAAAEEVAAVAPSQQNDGDCVPFLWHNNHPYPINDLLGPSPQQWKINTTYGINDRGQIICCGVPADPARRIRLHHAG